MPKDRFKLSSFSSNSTKDFLPKLEKIFRECGVAFVLLPSLKNCGVNGVVRWYGDKVVLAINDRNSYADTFWFSLFHEIGHVLQKKKTKSIALKTFVKYNELKGNKLLND